VKHVRLANARLVKVLIANITLAAVIVEQQWDVRERAACVGVTASRNCVKNVSIVHVGMLLNATMIVAAGIVHAHA